MSKFMLDILMTTLPELVCKKVCFAERDLSKNKSNSHYSDYIEKRQKEKCAYNRLKDFAGEDGWMLLDDFNDAKNSIMLTLACASYKQGFKDAILHFALSGKEEENLLALSGKEEENLRKF
mgnify:CR=1 FL=1